jgi:flagellar motor switch protein FliM
VADIRPFDYKGLPKVSRQDLKLLDALQSFLPRIGFSDDLGRSLRQLLIKELGASFSFRREKIETANLGETLRRLSPQGVYLLFGMAPLESKAILEVDPFFAQMAVDKLLGGRGEPFAALRPLTEIEEGILSYLFLKILRHLFERCGRSARVHFRLEEFCSSPDEILRKVRGGEGAVLMTFRLVFGERSGYARLVLPSPFVQKGLLEPLEGMKEASSEERDFQYYAARLENFGFVETSLWAELGRTTLKAKELNSLEPGDVVLVENAEARVTNGRLEGYLAVRLGTGGHGAFRAKIMEGEKGRSRRSPLRLQLEGMELEHPVGKGA